MVAALATAGVASAQIFKCPGPGGRVILTDAPCPDGQAVKIRNGNTVAPEPAAADNPFDQFDNAPTRAQIIGDDRQAAPAAPAYPPEPKRRPRASGGALPPVIITSCDGTGCWDTSGTRYNRSGGMFFRQDGAACHLRADQMRCP